MVDQPLNILIMDPHLRGGGQVSYVTRLAGELTRRGHRAVIGCKPDSVLAEAAQHAGCEAHNAFMLRGGLRPRAWTHDLRAIRRYIQQAQPDILHVNGSQDHWVCGVGNRTLGRPSCVVRTRHNTYTVKDSVPNRVLNRAWTDYQIVVCDVVRERLAGQAAFDQTRMCSIHNGVNAEEYRPDPAAREEARSEFGYAPEHMVCGIAARLVKDKGHTFLFQAVAQLRSELPQLRLLVLGQGVLEAQLKQQARDLGIEQQIQFAGFRNDMARCTQAFDIGAQPSIGCDTSSFSLKEQMTAEKPVVASDYGGLKEIVTDGEEGFVVPTGTVAPLAKALRDLAQQPELREKMGKAGRQRVLRDFTVQVFAERTIAAYRRALDIHRARGGKRP